MCSCASCSYTDKFIGKLDADGKYISGSAFASWPRGEPAGQRSSDAAYRAHWAHCNAMRPYKAPEKLPDAAAWYGTPAGTTRGEVARVLRQQFGLEPTPAPEISVAEAVKPAHEPKHKPTAVVPVAGPGIAELLQRAIDMRAERERLAA